MKKRTLAGFLWFLVTWFGWSYVAAATGTSELLGPVLGVVAAVLVASDPLDRIWRTHVVPDRSAAISGSA